MTSIISIIIKPISMHDFTMTVETFKVNHAAIMYTVHLNCACREHNSPIIWKMLKDIQQMKDPVEYT